MAAAAAIKEVLWFQKLLTDLHLDFETIDVFISNQSAIKLKRVARKAVSPTLYAVRGDGC